jgi:DNA-binding YbaB/EbfC family protein
VVPSEETTMNMKNLNKLMKQAQEMQQKMAAMSEEIAEREVTASAGGGMVEVVANGRHELKSIKIKPEVVDKDDVEMLEDLILAAVNEAQRQADEMMRTEMDKVTGGMQLPGMF